MSSIVAVYSGDPKFTGNASTTLAQVVEDFSITLTPQPTNPAGSTGQTVIPGNAATFNATLMPLLGPFNFPITLSATGLPPGATVAFSPPTSTPGTSAALVTITVQTAVNQGLNHRKGAFGGATVAIALLLVPFTRRLQWPTRQTQVLHSMKLIVALLVCAATLGGIMGCGADAGTFHQPQQTYPILVTATAVGADGYALQHTLNVTLSVQ